MDFKRYACRMIVIAVAATASGCAAAVPLAVLTVGGVATAVTASNGNANGNTNANTNANTDADTNVDADDTNTTGEPDETIDRIFYSNGTSATVTGNTIVRTDGSISTIVGGAGDHVVIANSDGTISVGVDTGGMVTVITP